MNGYITKYALSKTGIIETEIEICNAGGGSMVIARKIGTQAYFHGEGRDWHRTKESAAKRANAMKTKKIAALKKKITELESLNFAQHSR